MDSTWAERPRVAFVAIDNPKMTQVEAKEEDEPRIVVSVVSHGHGDALPGLLSDLTRILPERLTVVLTANDGADLSLAAQPLGDRVRLIRNEQPRGFGANHNAAFRAAAGDVFCVCNPDVRLRPETLPPLLQALRDPGVGVAAPRVVDSRGNVQDNLRRELTPARVLGRLWNRGPEFEGGSSTARPDWVAGMFMAFPWPSFRAVGGFDERFFLYCEDADICRRLRDAGLRIEFVSEAIAVHDAQRASHRNLVFLTRHLRSLARYWLVPAARTGTLNAS